MISVPTQNVQKPYTPSPKPKIRSLQKASDDTSHNSYHGHSKPYKNLGPKLQNVINIDLPKVLYAADTFSYETVENHSESFLHRATGLVHPQARDP